MVLVNAAFFKGFWAHKFDKEDTRNETFNGATPADVEMMSVSGRFNAGELEDLNADYLEMPYKMEDESLSMYVLLPHENTPTAVDDLLNKLSSETISRVLSSRGGRPNIHVKFPKMELASEYGLLSVSGPFNTVHFIS